MTDKINVKIECGGYTITGDIGAGNAAVIASKNRKPAWYGSSAGYLTQWVGSGPLLHDIFFYVKSETPGKLHKFKGIEYLGLVDAPFDYERMLRDLLEKFQGALVIDGNNGAVIVVYKDNIVTEGCGQIMACLKESLIPLRNTDVGTFYRVQGVTISLAMVSAARNLGEQFTKEHEMLMKP